MDSLLPTLCQRFPMSFGAIWLRMMALQQMERYRHDNPWERDRMRDYRHPICREVN
jgi:hypothetical protein